MNSVATHAHARTAVARITQRMWHTTHMHTFTLRGHFGQGGFCFFGGSRQLVVPSSLRKMAEDGEKNGYQCTYQRWALAHWDHHAQSVDKPSAARCGILNYTSKMSQMECRHPGMFSGRGLTEFSGADQSFVEAREHSAACC